MQASFMMQYFHTKSDCNWSTAAGQDHASHSKSPRNHSSSKHEVNHRQFATPFHTVYVM